jgi:hypothetical protein
MTEDISKPQPPAPTTALKPWQPGGPSPNYAGRGKNTPNKFSKAFLHDVSKKWAQHGADVLEEVRRSDPSTFLRVCASLIPKERLVITHSTTPVQQLSETELQAILVEDLTAVENGPSLWRRSRLCLGEGRGPSAAKTLQSYQT